ncbi:Heavy-metal-associated domain protein [Rubripirellula lacrimiformis]|uniref:Heavy-metal-associated domain protein n=1 Tax=Rubripirellula lacrimiformis TaxID=1930273 RepID=A0A517NCY4_9BACT|nr:heavy metal-associated domain-containing protein [Rubripirellula lacrimiformis]QDT04992.1 Heavy-metal-associated domain protein [Rubripirellula lacrimiformis]
MSKLFRSTGLVAGLVLLAVSVFGHPSAQAADTKKSEIVMTVGEMCGGCVKKITKRFEGVEGVAKLQCSIEKKSVVLTPKPNVRFSPKGVWEIMESIGKTPTKMITPSGTFTSKPKT